MNKQQSPIHLKGTIELTISPQDSLLWKLSMTLEAAHSSDQTIEQIAGKYGYSRECFYQLKDKLTGQGSQSLADRRSGPKTNYKRTMQVTRQVILHRFLDPEANREVIAQKLRQAGYSVSQRSVERIIGDFDLQKKGYIRQIRQSGSSS